MTTKSPTRISHKVHYLDGAGHPMLQVFCLESKPRPGLEARFPIPPKPRMLRLESCGARRDDMDEMHGGENIPMES